LHRAWAEKAYFLRFWAKKRRFLQDEMGGGASRLERRLAGKIALPHGVE
jgi:hypothetical protein